MMDFDKLIKSAIKSGKVYFGSKQSINAVKTGKAIAIIQAFNVSKKIKEEIQYYSNLSKIPIYTYPESAQDLGLLCGKPFMVSIMTIRSLSDQELIRVVKESYLQRNQFE
jgi:large subunit ribosomal protein L30e